MHEINGMCQRQAFGLTTCSWQLTPVSLQLFYLYAIGPYVQELDSS